MNIGRPPLSKEAAASRAAPCVAFCVCLHQATTPFDTNRVAPDSTSQPPYQLAEENEKNKQMVDEAHRSKFD